MFHRVHQERTEGEPMGRFRVRNSKCFLCNRDLLTEKHEETCPYSPIRVAKMLANARGRTPRKEQRRNGY